MRTVSEIDSKICELEEKLDQVEGRPTEVYTRIVGYYRSLRNWNRGKREEYSHRVLFDLEDAPAAQPAADPAELPASAARPAAATTSVLAAALDKAQPERYIYFFRETCPNCPPVRLLLADIELPGGEMDVDTREGTKAALEYGIYAAPTVVFFGSAGDEMFRVSSAAELSGLKIPQMA